jgi:hypothetical protein
VEEGENIKSGIYEISLNSFLCDVMSSVLCDPQKCIGLKVALKYQNLAQYIVPDWPSHDYLSILQVIKIINQYQQILLLDFDRFLYLQTCLFIRGVIKIRGA